MQLSSRIYFVNWCFNRLQFLADNYTSTAASPERWLPLCFDTPKLSMKYFYLYLFILFNSCKAQTKYPEGGFDYPKNIANSDTNFYYYPLKDIEPIKAAFQDSYAYLFYQPFNEPNLSIKPQKHETFRLTYSPVFGKSIIISLTEDSVVVKKGSPHIIYNEDTSQLTEIEKFHLNLLKRRFPIDTTGKKPNVKHYLDSLTRLYPELLDPAYYHKLYEKTIARSGENFAYSKIKIPITKKQFDSIVAQINSSGYWTLPYNIECDDPPMDGYGFTLEANTKEKYKIVSAIGCPSDTTMFPKICQKIVELASMDKELKLDSKWEVITAPIDK
jgi:hypothetical protein